MYATKAINGVPAIQRDGQSVLGVCEPKLGLCKLALRATQRTRPQVRIIAERAEPGTAQCERSRFQKGGTACLISRRSPRFLSLFLFITRNLMSSNCTAAARRHGGTWPHLPVRLCR